MIKRVGIVVAAVSLILVAVPAGKTQPAPPASCGLTTIQGTLDYSGFEEGLALACGPGQPLVVRTKFLDASKKRLKNRKVLASFITIADVQLADEESPLRAEWADKCEEHPATAAFRPHETMVPHLTNAHIRAADAIAEKGSPVMKADFDFAIGLGDLADNNQYNEIRWIIDLFDGDKMIDPDTGDEGYDGVQSADPEGAPNAEADVVSPVEGTTMLELANEPFWAVGLRAGGKSLPWYSLPGNHDIKIQGTAPNEAGWRDFASQYAVGGVKFTDVPPDKQQEACQAGFSEEFFTEMATNPGAAEPVPADPDRRLLSREEWAQEHLTTTGVPEGHGYGGERCKDDAGELLERLCYSWTEGDFHYIGLDTNPHEGLEDGNIDDPQFQWLEKDLQAHSSTYYTAEGLRKKNPSGDDKLIVVFAHHPQQSMTNTSTEGSHQAQDLKQLLLRFPNVIVMANGHTHQNRIWGRINKKAKTGYWEVNTSAIADFPSQSRTVEIVKNGDGTLSIFAVVFDAAVAPDVRSMDWADDPTNEVDLGGAETAINEDWLASYGREVMLYDPQQDLMKLGTPKDRNVELLLRAPRWFR
ncbi:MAG TPA: hypothetical protein VNP73_12090 [Actinomycetota bacterium]|nr:hypothetical protein [Actinomycetota bacterium]